MVTSSHVRGETWTLLRRRTGHRPAVEFLDALERTPQVQIVRIETVRLETVRIETAQEEDALRWLRRHDEREYAFIDAASFAS